MQTFKLLLLVAGLWAASAAAAHAQGDVWILENGTYLVTDAPDSTSVSLANNRLYGASGVIQTGGDHCDAGNPVPHFHGTLNGKTDNGQGCGHGKAKKVPNAGQTADAVALVNDLNVAINVVIGGTWGAECTPNGETAGAALEDAKVRIEALKTVIMAALDGKKEKELLEKAEKLASRISKAQVALSIAGETTANQAQELLETHSDDIKKKIQKFLKDLAKQGLLGPS